MHCWLSVCANTYWLWVWSYNASGSILAGTRGTIINVCFTVHSKVARSTVAGVVVELILWNKILLKSKSFHQNLDNYTILSLNCVVNYYTQQSLYIFMMQNQGLTAVYWQCTHNTCCSIHTGGRCTLIDVYCAVCACPPRCTSTAVAGNHILQDRKNDS